MQKIRYRFFTELIEILCVNKRIYGIFQKYGSVIFKRWHHYIQKKRLKKRPNGFF